MIFQRTLGPSSHASLVSLSGSAVLCVCLVGLTGCEAQKEPAPVVVSSAARAESPAPTDPHAKLAPAHGAPAEQQVPGTEATDVAISWDVPEGFKEMPPRPMRKATYQLEGAAGPAEVAVFYFGAGQGGGVDANIQRWVGQFQNLPEGAAKRSEAEVNGLKHFSVEVEKGTFQSGMPGAPAGAQTDFAMRATIVQAKSGQYFFKMTGPAATVAEHKDAFASLLATVREK